MRRNQRATAQRVGQRVAILFAYGTLRRGAPMHGLLEGRTRWIGPASVAGRPPGLPAGPGLVAPAPGRAPAPPRAVPVGPAAPAGLSRGPPPPPRARGSATGRGR